MVHVVLHPRGIAPSSFKFDSWSPGAGFYLYYIHQWNKSDKERIIVGKKLSFMHTRRSNRFFKRWLQFRVGAIPRQPWNMNMTLNLGFIFMYLFYFFPPSLSPFLFLHALSLSPFLSISIRISQSLCLYLSFPFFYPFLFLVYVIPYSPFCYISISTHLFIKSFVK